MSTLLNFNTHNEIMDFYVEAFIRNTKVEISRERNIKSLTIKTFTKINENNVNAISTEQTLSKLFGNCNLD